MTRTPQRQASPETYRRLLALDHRLRQSLGTELYDLVKLRASQINGCAYCVDMHATDLENQGMPSRTIHGVAAWRESPFFDESQRVALAFAETLTGGIDRIDQGLWEQATRLLGDERRADLVFAVGTINTWKMSGIAVEAQPSA
jgi:AhpD family alkylhydroperoxidase